ncbi:MAG: TauD/TfdA family dioxygenase [Pseudomonadota bacterium]
MVTSSFDVLPLSPSIGAEINGLDLTQPLSEALLAELRSVWLERKVLLFREQYLSIEQQVSFTQQFGELDKYPFLRGIGDNPYVAPVLKQPDETVNFGGVWHSDTTYLETPALGATLSAVEVPPTGGDTIFVDMVAAYEALSSGLKTTLASLNAVNTSNKSVVSKTRVDRIADHGDDSAPEVFTSIHPVIRRHPETRRQALYVNEAHTTHFENWTPLESKPLLDYLHQHQRRPEFQCRFCWSKGAIMLWDNRSTHHYPLNDYHGHRRLMHRVSLKGDVPAR